MEKEQIHQLQEDVVNRIKQDMETKRVNQEDNLLNTRLQESVEELNVNSLFIFLRSFSSSSFLDDYERLCETNGINQWHTSSYC